MKRCGQWFALLWVSTTLAWSQAPAISTTTATGRSDLHWDEEQVQAPSLLSDFTLIGTKKANDTASETKKPATVLLQACVIGGRAPLLLCFGHSILVQTRPAEAASIGLPLSCGPPAQT